MSIKELKTHGREDFPLQLYKLTPEHPKYVMVNHWHTSIEIIKVKSGTLNLTVDNVSYALNTNDVFIINAESVHGATPIDCCYECLVFNPRFLKNDNRDCNNFIDKILNGEVIFTSLVKDKDIKDSFFELFSDVDNGKDDFIIIGELYKILGQLKQNNQFERTLQNIDGKFYKKNKIKIVLKYIRENYQSLITLESLAQLAGLSTNYFSYYFKNMTGLSPIDYLISYRIEKASNKLLSTDESITKIAFDSGFTDLSYFIKVFKSHTGLTPNKYRNME